MKNPYLELGKMMGLDTEIRPSFFMSKIVSVSPLTINLNDITLYNDDFKIDSTLKKEILNIGDDLLIVEVNGTYIAVSKVVSS